MESTSDPEGHRDFMRQCMSLAERGKGHVSPNPLVGAIVVRNGRVIARGWHRRFGGPHAEAECLDRAHGDLRHATLYVNLEPCAHFGKTPPCAERIIASGIGTVVVAMKDPNPLVAGRGIRALRSSGVRVAVGVMEQEARWVNRFFIRHITRRSPYVHVKIAQSMDGFIGGLRSRGRITSQSALRLVHRWRAEHDAVLIGAGTVRADNPRLTVRHIRGRDPHVVIIDGRLSVPEEANALRRIEGRAVFVCVEKRSALRARLKVRRLEQRGIVVLPFRGKRGKISIRELLEALYRFGIGSVLVEGGTSVFTQCMNEEVADEVSIFVAPVLLGRGVPAFRGLRNWDSSSAHPAETKVKIIGRDVLFRSSITRAR